MTAAASVLRVVLGAAAVTTVALSFGTNALFWFETLKANPGAQALAVATSIVVGVFKVGIPAHIVAAKIKPRDARPLWALFLAVFVFDFMSGLGYAAMTRGEATAEQRDANGKRAVAIRDEREAAAKLAKLTAPAKAQAVLQAEYDVAIINAGDCRNRAHMDVCKLPGKINIELAGAKAHGAAERELRASRAKLAELPPEKEADPLIAATIRAAAFAGLAIGPDTATSIWGLLLLLIYELGSTAAVAGLVRPKPDAEPEPVTVTQPAPPVTQVAGTDLATALQSIQDGKLSVKGCTVLTSGAIKLSQTDLADTLAISKPQINRRLKALALEGAISLQTSNAGTIIKLLHSPLFTPAPQTRTQSVTHV